MLEAKYPAGRGYAYVAISRVQDACRMPLEWQMHMFQCGRAPLEWKPASLDFLPVGEDKEDEQLERGYHSLNFKRLGA